MIAFLEFHGAKHSPPGDQWPPDWPEGGGPPLCVPETPLTCDIYGSRGAKQSPPGDQWPPDWPEGGSSC